MNAADFKTLCIEARLRQDAILFTKGVEYTQGAEDRGANFKRIAERLGVDPMVVWYVYFQKHVDAIAAYVKFGKVQSDEPIEGRFDDCMNYLLLGLLLVNDRQAQEIVDAAKLVNKDPAIPRGPQLPLPAPDNRYHCRVCPNVSYSVEQKHEGTMHEQDTCHCVVINTGSRYLRVSGGEFYP